MSARGRVELLGVEVDRITGDELVAAVVDAVRQRRRLRVANHNLHSTYLVQDDPRMARWYERADIVFVDGMSLVAASRFKGRALARAHRATVLDWMPDVLDHAAAEGWRVYHLGGDPAWTERGADAWRIRHPGLLVEVHHGYFPHEDSAEVVAAINAAQPDLVLVGMGSPLQERWLADHVDSLDAPVVVVVGSFLGIAARNASVPPRWVGQIGLEWAWRLASDPRRLARRYLVEPLLLLRARWRR